MAAVFLVLVLACAWYVNDYYHADSYVESFLQSSDTVAVTIEDNMVFLDGSGTEHALIFYPGAKGRELMPGEYTELCIEGGNHAWFAYYGEQEGDGAASITREEQQKKTVDAVLGMILE